jgi:hypothetical protein
VAAPPVRAWAWIAGAAAAGAALLAVALHGERPEAGLARFEPNGVMVAVAPARVVAVELRRAGRAWHFSRTPTGWTASPGQPPGPRDPTPLVELGLRLLHGSAPQRVMDGVEARALTLSEVGLEPPVLTVRAEVQGAAPFSVDIGGPNPQGLARYARVAGRDEVVLLNHYVADPWQALTEAP